MTIWLILLALVWLAGTWVRVYKQARFFQIEEYMNLRYLRWWLRDVGRISNRFWIPRALMITAIACVLILVIDGTPRSRLPVLLGIFAALMAVWPPDEGEIKKAFRPTDRAKRLLAASFGVAVFDVMTYGLIIHWLTVPESDLEIVAIMIAGFVLLWSAPLILVCGNILMIPVEGFFRRRFIGAARAVMRQANPHVIGITGSYGKTTTKNFVTDILNGRYRVYATPKSYNTLMGICLAINNDLKDDYSLDYFVVEMGAYIRGEIERICSLTPPQIAIVTAIGPQHLERFGTLETTQEAKYEIIKNLPPDGVGVFNWDNPYVRGMMERGYPKTRIGVSQQVDPKDPNAPRFVASDIVETLDGLAFTVHDREAGQQVRFETSVIGLHNITNILLATAVALQEGMTLADVAFRVRNLRPAESRLVRQVSGSGVTIINDAYSANPDGIVSALRVLSLHQTGRRVLVTPGMVELGDLHVPENKRLGELSAQHATDVILVGKVQTAPIYDGLMSAGFDKSRVQVVDELRQAMTWIDSTLQRGDTVLFLNDLPDTY